MEEGRGAGRRRRADHRRHESGVVDSVAMFTVPARRGRT